MEKSQQHGRKASIQRCCRTCRSTWPLSLGEDHTIFPKLIRYPFFWKSQVLGFRFRCFDSQVISLVMLQLCTLFMLPVERALFMTGLVCLFENKELAVVIMRFWWLCSHLSFPSFNHQPDWIGGNLGEMPFCMGCVKVWLPKYEKCSSFSLTVANQLPRVLRNFKLEKHCTGITCLYERSRARRMAQTPPFLEASP